MSLDVVGGAEVDDAVDDVGGGDQAHVGGRAAVAHAHGDVDAEDSRAVSVDVTRCLYMIFFYHLFPTSLCVVLAFSSASASFIPRLSLSPSFSQSHLSHSYLSHSRL